MMKEYPRAWESNGIWHYKASAGAMVRLYQSKAILLAAHIKARPCSRCGMTSIPFKTYGTVKFSNALVKRQKELWHARSGK